MAQIMTLFKNRYRVESARLPRYDYTSPGRYFVTICTHDKACHFGDVVNGRMCLSPIGEIVADEWRKAPKVRPNVILDSWVVMPNHLHGIIVIDEMKTSVETHGDGNVSVETTQRVVSTTTKTTLQRNSLGAIIGQFKSKCTKRIHAAGFGEFSWQARFHDHIVRDGSDLDRIRQYILDNPADWSKDDNYPRNIRMDRLHHGESQL